MCSLLRFFFFSLSTKPFRFILVGVICIKFISLIAEYYFIVCMCHSLCIHLPTERQLGCFQFLSLTKLLWTLVYRALNEKVKVASRVWLFATPWTTVYGILQNRILEWLAFSFSRCSFQPRDGTQISHIAGRFFTSWATRKAQNVGVGSLSFLQ